MVRKPEGERYTHPEYPRLVIFRRPAKNRFYHAQIYLDGKLKQWSLKTEDPRLALRLAAEGYKTELRASAAEAREHPNFDDPILGELFKSYKSTLKEKQQTEALKRWGPIQHFWRTKKLTDVTSSTFTEFYAWRKGVSAHTLHKDVCCVRQLLKYAELETEVGFALPRIPKTGRIEPNPRPWFSKAEWIQLREKAQKRIAEEHRNPKLSRQRYDCWEFAEFMLASMCRVDDLKSLRFQDCQIETVDKRKILRCEFVAKNHIRTSYASSEAVTIYQNRLKRAGGNLAAKVFEGHHRDAFRELLIDADLYKDRFSNTRNYKAVRATSITFALLRPNPPTIYQIALNAGTSVSVIEKFYAKRLTAEHGKDVLTAAEKLPSMWKGRKG